MIKTKKEFAKLYPKKDSGQTREELLQWVQHMKDGNTSEVLLTRIVVESTMNFAYVVKGYHIHYVTSMVSNSFCTYSELTGGMFGTHLLYDYGDIGLAPHHPTLLYRYSVKELYSISKDRSKQILMLGCFPFIFMSTITSTEEPIPESGISDPVLALVATIHKLPEENQSALLMLFDKYGPTNTLLGRALIHLDKFRSF